MHFRAHLNPDTSLLTVPLLPLSNFRTFTGLDMEPMLETLMFLFGFFILPFVDSIEPLEAMLKVSVNSIDLTFEFGLCQGRGKVRDKIPINTNDGTRPCLATGGMFFGHFKVLVWFTENKQKCFHIFSRVSFTSTLSN